MTALHRMLADSALACPDAAAVRDRDGEIAYAELDAMANRAARALAALGVGRGDRVAVWLNKSVRAVAAMQGALRLGAAYVPVDPMSPAARASQILADCSVAALVAPQALCADVRHGALSALPVLTADGAPGGSSWSDLEALDGAALTDPGVGPDDLAYILYTSGSTGTPKGVCISHRNAQAFVEWAARTAGVRSDDRLSNHAPFHFDLSVFDVYAAFLTGARLTILPENAAYAPRDLVEFAVSERITVWYSVPSALIMMMESGGLLEADHSLRAVIFAGEPFPIRHLRHLREALSGVRMFNWYGPTETNVCTSFEVTSIAENRTAPVPIGTAASGDRVWAERPDGTITAAGEEGELVADGPTVMLGYWGGEPQAGRPYRTGDLVRLEASGDYTYVGRLDQMVKVRGHRVELGDVEAALLAHPDVAEAAVVVAGSGIDARLVAFLCCAGDPPPPLLEFKRHCAERLPRYMIVDQVRHLPELPRTRNGKIDRLTLTKTATTTEVTA